MIFGGQEWPFGYANRTWVFSGVGPVGCEKEKEAG